MLLQLLGYLFCLVQAVQTTLKLHSLQTNRLLLCHFLKVLEMKNPIIKMKKLMEWNKFKVNIRVIQISDLV